MSPSPFRALQFSEFQTNPGRTSLKIHCYNDICFIEFLLQAFPKGSPLVPDVSRAILSVMESESMVRITDKWFRNETNCSEQDVTLIASDSLALDSFKGIFLIAGVAAISALLIFFFNFLNQNKDILASGDHTTWQKVCALARAFCEVNLVLPEVTEKSGEGNEEVLPMDTTYDVISPASRLQTSIAQSPEVFTCDEGLITTEPPSPLQDTMSGTEDAAEER
ncbi:hypothetical protein DM860_018167 [Cuscuta australis]|uniref:Solute-binding protein family 3/N-terminal domain-containing protein n=1 Tax=Cuscuta australis TaxID=267555 RepID=A0A328DJ77_9ASTE|nr:hypothetical protein DM860_018167 [Cuscuta australis]